MSEQELNTSNVLESTTPRTLLSSLLDHQETTKTVRQPSRQISRATYQSYSDETEKVYKKRRKTSLLRSQDSNYALSSKTPKTLIAEALDQTDTFQTLRAPVRNVSRITETEENEANAQMSSPTDKEIADIFHFEKKARKKRIRLSEIDVVPSKPTTPDVFLMDLQARIKSIMKVEKSRKEGEKKKSRRKHETDISSHSTPDQLSIKKNNVTSEATQGNDQEIYKSQDDAVSETVPISEDVPPISGEYQGKEFSTNSSVDFPEESLNRSVPPKQADQTDSVPQDTIVKQQESSKPKIPDSGHRDNSERVYLDREIEGLAEPALKSTLHTSPTQDATETSGVSSSYKKREKSSKREDSTTIQRDNYVDYSNVVNTPSMEKTFGATADVEPSSLNDTETIWKRPSKSGFQNSQRSVTEMFDKSKVVNAFPFGRKGESNVKVSERRKSIKRRKPYNLPFARTQLQGLVKHYKSMNFSKEAFSMIEEVSEEYFQNTARYLEEICQKKGRKKIKMEDVKQLMEKRRHISNENDFTILVEKYLPLEHREELIPIAVSGNKTLP